MSQGSYRGLAIAFALACVATPVACGIDLAGSGPADAIDAAAVDATGADARDGSFSDASDANEPDDGASDGAPRDAGHDAPSDVDASCPSDRGGTMVRVGAFCIDATEVTQKAYLPFATLPVDGGLLPPECAFKTSFIPVLGVPTPESTAPVLVDWCDAFAFCKWVGKSLCGAMDGGALAPGDVDSFTTSEWNNACTNDGTTKYPYGDMLQPDACASAALHPVGTLPGCQGPAGVYDLIGNAWEWIDSCGPTPAMMDAATANCAIRGGSYEESSKDITCAHAVTANRGDGTGTTGFRCCLP